MPGEWDLATVLIAALGVLFIGLAKAGFGGALGMLTTPLCVVAFGAQGREPSFALGVLLPLLCAGDLFSMYHYWGKWDKRNLAWLLPGVVVGVCIGVLLIGRFTPRQLISASASLPCSLSPSNSSATAFLPGRAASSPRRRSPALRHCGRRDLLLRPWRRAGGGHVPGGAAAAQRGFCGHECASVYVD
jgi:uncharacterized membrane protein YfcA